MNYNQLTNLVIGSAIEVHKELGPGLLESTYKECLYYELKNKGLMLEKEIPQPIVYKEVKLDHGYRLDLYVERQLVVEIKSIDTIAQVHIAQTLTYMRLTNSKIGLLLNFNVARLKEGIRRLII